MIRIRSRCPISSVSFDATEAEDVHRVLRWPEVEYEVVFAALDAFREKASPSDRR